MQRAVACFLVPYATLMSVCCDAEALTPFLLGKEEETWRMVIEADEDLLTDIHSASYEMADLRSLMPELPVEQLAVAGHAVALNQWHKVCSPLATSCIAQIG